uniref:Uncharacterized protein n=1 Tax=Molossus molossus TaxID=27622 RepID=A0A7J8GLA5_MOLMO|nr:hypothetical protein HJG59_011483 [Molossus molossus]
MYGAAGERAIRMRGAPMGARVEGAPWAGGDKLEEATRVQVGGSTVWRSVQRGKKKAFICGKRREGRRCRDQVKVRQGNIRGSRWRDPHPEGQAWLTVDVLRSPCCWGEEQGQGLSQGGGFCRTGWLYWM